MKRMKQYMFGVTLAIAMLSMTACGSSNNETTAPTTTQTTTMAPTTNQTTTSERDTTARESEGVIDGVINDVEKGIDDMTGSTMAETTKAQ